MNLNLLGKDNNWFYQICKRDVRNLNIFKNSSKPIIVILKIKVVVKFNDYLFNKKIRNIFDLRVFSYKTT